MKFFLLLTIILGILGCGLPGESSNTRITTNIPTGHPSVEPSPTPNNPEPPYDGKTIDQIFPIVSDKSSLNDGEDSKGRFLIPVLGFNVEINHFAPRSLMRGNRELLKFKPTYNDDEYWTNLVGTAQLLGSRSNQIYIVYNGPGGVCCTNYLIVDVDQGSPRQIFRSEDFGSFRDPMEIFDAEGDGIYELVQFDSCFRYFMDDCGACAPEPRVTFKYDSRSKTYRPAVGLMQDFVKEAMDRQEIEIITWAGELKVNEDPSKQLDLERAVLDSFVQRLHIGDDAGAWKLFKTYFPKPSAKMLDEIDSRLKGCKFYQALKRTRRIQIKS